MTLWNTLPVLHPQGYFRSFWDPLIMALVIVSSVAVPLQATSRPPVTPTSVQVAFDSDLAHHEQLLGVWDTFDTIFDFLFIFDILLNFRTGYMQRGLFVRDPQLIAEAYFRSSFALDVRRPNSSRDIRHMPDSSRYIPFTHHACRPALTSLTPFTLADHLVDPAVAHPRLFLQLRLHGRRRQHHRRLR